MTQGTGIEPPEAGLVADRTGGVAVASSVSGYVSLRGALRHGVARARLAPGPLAVSALTVLVVAAFHGRAAAAAGLLGFGLALAVVLWKAADWPGFGVRRIEQDGMTTTSDTKPLMRDIEDGWRLVIDALPEPAIALDHLAAVMHYNAQLRDLFPKVRIGAPISHVSRNPELIAAIDKARVVGQPIVAEIVERLPIDRRISVSVSRLTEPGGQSQLPALLLTFRDLSEQDRLEQMRADFIANASHELRTPLASLRGFVETLQGPAREDPAARDRFLGLMASQATRMTRLIDDLLSLSRVEMRAHLPPRGAVDLNDAAAFVVQTLEPLARSAKITMSLKKLDRAARIRGDREEIVQVLQNLVQNAIKYGREGGMASIVIERLPAQAGSPATLSAAVIDDGPGIAAQHLPRLTERFYRVNAASSREKGGTGLGLAIVKHIVLRHRGDLKIASQPGVGSRFTVVFDELPAGERI